MSIRNVDREETNKILSNKQRQSREIERLKIHELESESGCSSTTLLSGSGSDPSQYLFSSDDDFINPNLLLKNTQIRTKIPTLDLVCVKYGISDRSAAAIASGVLNDVGIITTDSSKKFDQNEVRRERKKSRNTARKKF
ncbi:unnamed protein product [Psylliodes chrysocephalus]|uniref:Uncharacterized protein n=1 Tax=Psylliodes chrysocephalus TaxID=3402493 RepID=A0A9P0CTM7_9CUCU|nr:unnamed protein product [Psylliodes chrysocephala]